MKQLGEKIHLHRSSMTEERFERLDNPTRQHIWDMLAGRLTISHVSGHIKTKIDEQTIWKDIE